MPLWDLQLNDAHEVSRAFKFDHCYNSMDHDEGWVPVNNGQIYKDMVSPGVKDVCDGYNVNILMYGQTGTGKTHTMAGTESDPGAIPLACADLFNHLAIRPGTQVKASFVEIYNDQVWRRFQFAACASVAKTPITHS